MTRELMNELAELSKPLQEWLYANTDPHHKITIDSTSMYLFSEVCGIPNKEILERG